MPTLNCDIPGGHFYALVRKEFLYNLEAHHGEFEEAAVFGICSVPNRGLGFHVLLESGAQFARLPLHALVHKRDAPQIPLNVLQVWDCFGYDVAAHAFEYLKERECRVYLKNGRFEWGLYLFTVDWLANGYSDEPSQHKNAHVIKLENGCFCAVPNNRVLWRDASFTHWPEGKPDYKTNTHVWHAEEGDGQIDEHVMGGDRPSQSQDTKPCGCPDNGEVCLHGIPAGLMGVEPTYRPGVYFGINRSAWVRYEDVPETCPSCSGRLVKVFRAGEHIESWCLPCNRTVCHPLLSLPKHERRQYGARSVRQWFRQMRAADFEKDVKFVTDAWGAMFYVRPELRPWTLFDTQQVVERETAAFYLRPEKDEMYFVYGGRIVGRIQGIDWGARSSYPMFSSRVPAGAGRGITWDDVYRAMQPQERPK